MDYHYLRAINLQLETLILEKERERLRPGLGLLFEAGWFCLALSAADSATASSS